MEYHSTIDLYNKDWKLLYSFEYDKNMQPEFGESAHVDQEGKLYTVSFIPYPHLKKLEVIFEE